MSTRKQPVVQMRLSRFLILCLALVALGAVAHDWLAGRAMWRYYSEVAAAQVAEAEQRSEVQAQAIVKQMRGQLDAAGVAHTLPAEHFTVSPKTQAELRKQTDTAKQRMMRGADRAGDLCKDSPGRG
jgi:hypothetical protein